MVGSDLKKNVSGKRILLVEDDPLLVQMYSEKFAIEGMNLVSAFDGEEGLDKALNENFDVIVLDLLLPRLSGNEILKRLQEQGKEQTTPILILTNMSEQEEAKKAISLGAKEYLVKADLTPSQLVDKIKSYID